MNALLIGLLTCTLVGVAVLIAVAVPHLREGSRVLTPDGEKRARRVGRRLRGWLETGLDAVQAALSALMAPKA